MGKMLDRMLEMVVMMMAKVKQSKLSIRIRRVIGWVSTE